LVRALGGASQPPGMTAGRPLQGFEESGITAKVKWRLIPFLFLCYILNYIDRTNVAIAALQMQGDLNFSDIVYAAGAGIFFVGYVVFEIPSNLILARVGARFWIARIMISWGFISAAMMFVRSPASFYALRFLLGVAEAGFFPGILFYLSHWVPQRERATTSALFLTSTALSGVIGNPLSGAILGLQGLAGLAGWQWVFLLEGIPSVICGFAVLWYLDDKPTDAEWLSPRERTWLSRHIEAEKAATRREHDHSVLEALVHPRVWLLCVLYFSVIISFYSMTFWTPLIVKSVAGLSDSLTGTVSALPFLAAAIAMVLVGRHSDHSGERRWHLAATTWTAALALLAAGLFPSAPPAATIAALCVACAGIWSIMGPFWALPTEFLTGTAAAGGIALVNSVGNIGGFVGPNLMARAKALTGDFSGGFLILSATLALSGLIAVVGLRSSRHPQKRHKHN